MQDLHNTIRHCSKCQHIQARLPRPGFPVGRYPLFLIGAEPGPGATDSPSEEEYQQRFMPNAENTNTIKLIFRDLQEVGIEPSKIFFTNSVKCPSSKRHARIASQHCTDYIPKQIQYVNPKLIVIIGRAASHLNLEQAGRFDINEIEYYTRKALVISHPQGASCEYRIEVAQKIKELLIPVT